MAVQLIKWQTLINLSPPTVKGSFCISKEGLSIHKLLLQKDCPPTCQRAAVQAKQATLTWNANQVFLQHRVDQGWPQAPNTHSFTPPPLPVHSQYQEFSTCVPHAPHAIIHQTPKCRYPSYPYLAQYFIRFHTGMNEMPGDSLFRFNPFSFEFIDLKFKYAGL